MTELIALTRHIVGFDAPPPGGEDKLSDTDILRWLNDRFKKMVDSVFGIPVYLSLTIATDGTIVVADSNSDPLITDGLMVKTAEDYTYLSWPNLRSMGRPINRTTEIAKSDAAPLERVNRNEPMWQYRFRNSGAYYEYYDYVPGKGLVLLPITITTENAIKIPYKQDYVRLLEAEKPTAFFSEDDCMAPVCHAAFMCAIGPLDAVDPKRFKDERDDVARAFLQKAYTKDTGTALGFDNIQGNVLAR